MGPAANLAGVGLRGWPVAALLASAVDAGGARLAGAWVSQAEVDGESDLVVELVQGDERVVVLVENKIAAAFQPDQGSRYRARAGRLAASGARRHRPAGAAGLLLAPGFGGVRRPPGLRGHGAGGAPAR